VYEPGSTTIVSSESENNTRYQHIRNIFQAEKMIDPYHPHAPSLIDRRFNIDRELSEKEVEDLLTSVTSAPVLKDIASLIQERLGRPLEPFDIWYTGFKPRTKYSEASLDQKVGKLYPDVESFQKDIPYILRQIGFSPQKAEFLAQHIAVDPSRGAGHAMGAMMRDDRAHLRTRIPEGGMKYKGYNIAIHELGHNVEQVFSLNGVDYYSMNGVPNTAFTEAFAFVFQSRDMDILGISSHDQQAEDLRALNDMWATFEISGVALTDMYIWRWMYENPNADAEQVKQAMLEITKSVWNKYFAPLLGMNDQILLAVYSHIVDGGMYTPDYPLGHIISFQIEEYLKNHALATEMERMCKLGRLSPQIWMQQAVGEKISVTPMIHAAERAVQNLKQ
jgi:oligoendopeptidase F